YFFTTSTTANENLKAEGKRDDQIFFVGNTMIDTLNKNMDRLRKPALWDEHGLAPGEYFVMTLHRPSNVDTRTSWSASWRPCRAQVFLSFFPFIPAPARI